LAFFQFFSIYPLLYRKVIRIVRSNKQENIATNAASDAEGQGQAGMGPRSSGALEVALRALQKKTDTRSNACLKLHIESRYIPSAKNNASKGLSYGTDTASVVRASASVSSVTKVFQFVITNM
jgi:hypothetical protein